MTSKEIALKLILGETVVIKDNLQAKEVQKILREFKSNCTAVLSQLSENIKINK